jgi:hypothetical protein
MTSKKRKGKQHSQLSKEMESNKAHLSGYFVKSLHQSLSQDTSLKLSDVVSVRLKALESVPAPFIKDHS